MKDTEQEQSKKVTTKEVSMVSEANEGPTIIEPTSFEDLYIKERKKSQVFILSTAVFAALFVIALAYGLRAGGQEDRRFDTMHSQSMMQSGHYGRQGREY